MSRFAVVSIAVWMAALASATHCEPTMAATEPAVATPIDVHWVEHQVQFHYLGLTTYYTCDSLREKLIDLLRLAGARRDMAVSTGGCSFSNGAVSPMIHVRLHYYSPTLAGTETSAADLPAPAAVAHWQSVKLADGKPRSIARGDCELIEQFRDHVLKTFEVRNLAGDIVCVPHQLPAFNRMSLSFEALVATHATEEESIQQEKQPKKRDDTMKSERK